MLIRLLLSISIFGFCVSSDAQENSRTLGNKSFEVSNHLGNVMAVVSDRKTPTPETTNTSIAYQETNIKAFNDYYPYGMMLEGRTDTLSYRFGFNGMESDDEVYNFEGSSYDFGARMYDSRIGRFNSLDPLSKDLVSFSDYSFAGNSPIAFVDADGLGPIFVVASFKQTAKIKSALKAGNYKEVQRILYYGSTHDYVDDNGNKSSYLRDKIKKENGVDIPKGGTLLNLGDTKDGYTKIYGINENEDGKIEAVLLGEVKLEVFNEEVDKKLNYKDKTPLEVFDEAFKQNISQIDEKTEPIIKEINKNNEVLEDIERQQDPVMEVKGESWGLSLWRYSIKSKNINLIKKILPQLKRKKRLLKFKKSKGEKSK